MNQYPFISASQRSDLKQAADNPCDERYRTMIIDLQMNSLSSGYRSLTGIFIVLLLLILNACASLPSDYEQLPSYVIEDTQDTLLASKVEPEVARHSGKSGFFPLATGMDAFVARAAIITTAERSLDVQYYIWHSDTTGKLLVNKLLQAADRGVRIRLLLDDLDTAGKDDALNLLDFHPNIEVRLYNPFAHRGSRALGFITDLSRVNRRMHNKSMTADNMVTIVGGRNIGNEYFGATSHAEFSDLDVLAMGPIVQDVSSMFDIYWNSDEVIPITAFASDEPITEASFQQARSQFSQSVEVKRSSPYVNAIHESGVLTRFQFEQMDFSWGKAVLLYDAPSKVTATEVTADTHLAPQLGQFIKKVKHELIIISPYFVPGYELVEFLGELVEQGIRVRILTNSMSANDVGVVHAGYMKYREALLLHGVELYEFKSILEPEEKIENKKWTGSSRASLHAKTFGIDRQMLFVGSFNLDPRSVEHNTELGIMFESHELAAELGESFDDNIAHKAYRLQLKTIPADESDSGFAEYDLEWVTQENGNWVTYDVEPNTNEWQRFMAGFLSIFVIESLL